MGASQGYRAKGPEADGLVLADDTLSIVATLCARDDERTVASLSATCRRAHRICTPLLKPRVQWRSVVPPDWEEVVTRYGAPYMYVVVILGPPGSGKTCLLRSMAEICLPWDGVVPTKDRLDFYIRKVPMSDRYGDGDRPHCLHLWDTPGLDFVIRPLGRSEVLLAVDLSGDVAQWQNLQKQMNGDRSLRESLRVAIVVGTKSDAAGRREQHRACAKRFLESNPNCCYTEASSFTADGVDHLVRLTAFRAASRFVCPPPEERNSFHMTGII